MSCNFIPQGAPEAVRVEFPPNRNLPNQQSSQSVFERSRVACNKGSHRHTRGLLDVSARNGTLEMLPCRRLGRW